MGDTREIDDLKNISDSYKDALTVISFHRDTLSVRQIESVEKIDWIEAKDGAELQGLFPASRGSSGILFTGEGKAVKIDISPKALRYEMDKLMHVTN